MDLEAIAKECVRHILKHPALGMGNGELGAWCAAYRALDRGDRDRVQIALVKVRELAVVIGPYGSARFYGRGHAPEGAFSFDPPQPHGEIVARAIERS